MEKTTHKVKKSYRVNGWSQGTTCPIEQKQRVINKDENQAKGKSKVVQSTTWNVPDQVNSSIMWPLIWPKQFLYQALTLNHLPIEWISQEVTPWPLDHCLKEKAFRIVTHYDSFCLSCDFLFEWLCGEWTHPCFTINGIKKETDLAENGCKQNSSFKYFKISEVFTRKCQMLVGYIMLAQGCVNF